MPIKFKEENGGKTLAIHCTGTLTKTDYEHFISAFEQLVAQHGRLHVLFDLTGLHGLEVDALWDEIHFDIKHSSDIDRLAIVGDRKWQQGMAAFVKPFMKATSRYFDHADIAEARKWLETAPPLKSK